MIREKRYVEGGAGVGSDPEQENSQEEDREEDGSESEEAGSAQNRVMDQLQLQKQVRETRDKGEKSLKLEERGLQGDLLFMRSLTWDTLQ